MASTFTTASGSVLIIPDTSIDVIVSSNPSGIASSGIVTIVGEADEGPSWAQDAANGLKLSSNIYGPTDIQRVVQKYGSGRLVDAFRGLATPSASPRIQGSPTGIIIVKTNDSSAASRTTADNNGTFTAKMGGQLGNSIQEAVTTIQPETAPTTTAFTYAPSASAASLAARVNGGTKETLAISANTHPDALATAITSNMAGLSAVGGVNRAITTGLSALNTVAVQPVSGQIANIVLTSPAVWANAPAAGDTLNIPSGSAYAGAGNANVGWYVVTAAVNTTASATLTVTKVTAGAPVSVAATAFSATPANDIVDYSSMTLNNMTGTDRAVLTGLVGSNISASAAGALLTVTLATPKLWSTTPRVGDSVYVPASSVLAGAGSANVGWYTVTEVSNLATSAYLKASRLSNGSPVAVASVAIAATSDLQVLNTQIAGSGKSMEIEDNGGAVNVNTLLLTLGTTTAVNWLGTLLTSSAEREVQVTLKRTPTGSNEVFSPVGGNLSLLLGYSGTTATATIATVGASTMLTTTVTGGAGTNLSINLSQISSIGDLVTRINSNPGYAAAAASAQEAGRNPSVLDKVTAIGICTDSLSLPGRIKRDVYDMTLAPTSPSKGSNLASYTNIATAGLPEDNTFAFLSGGTRGASTGLSFVNAIDAMQGIQTNFVVPLVSQDATADIALGETDPASTYTVLGVNVAVKEHCIAMSTPKIKRNRIGVVSNRGSFQDAETMAGEMANFRIALCFQDVSDINSNGDIEQFQPWMASCKAAGMQAAGGYKPMFNKTVNIVKAIQAAGDFDDGNMTDCEQAILANMIPLQKQETGGYVFLTDQMTYGLDNNIVYNSMQAVYVSDLMALSLASSLKTAFVGESVADVTAATAESFVKGKMAEFLFLKFTVSTPTAPGGWKSIAIQISGNVMLVDVVAILATGIKFIPITLSIEGINTSASATGA